MDLTLSGADQVRFTTCLETLLSPLSYPDVDGWRRAVNRRMKELFDLEQAMFILSPAKGRALIHSEDYSAGMLAAYTVFFDTDTGNRRAESADLTVTNLETVVAGDWEGWRRDRFVNAFWRPNGVVDHVGLRLVEGKDRLAQLELHRDRVDPDHCGDRALALMRLLQPAFKAGVGAVFRLSASVRAGDWASLAALHALARYLTTSRCSRAIDATSTYALAAVFTSPFSSASGAAASNARRAFEPCPE